MLVAGLVFGCLLVFLSILAISFVKPQVSQTVSGTALVLVIEVPTDTPVLPTYTPTIAPTAEAGTPVPPPQGTINIGAIVKIAGTGLDGLRLRNQPGLQGSILFVAIESEVFRVDDGPQEADGYTWWHLTSPFDETVQGWAVSNYLILEQNP